MLICTSCTKDQRGLAPGRVYCQVQHASESTEPVGVTVVFASGKMTNQLDFHVLQLKRIAESINTPQEWWQTCRSPEHILSCSAWHTAFETFPSLVRSPAGHRTTAAMQCLFIRRPIHIPSHAALLINLGSADTTGLALLPPPIPIYPADPSALPPPLSSRFPCRMHSSQ